MAEENDKEILGKLAFGIGPTEAKEKGICISCKEKVQPHLWDEPSKREYNLKAICPTCWERMFGEDYA